MSNVLKNSAFVSNICHASVRLVAYNGLKQGKNFYDLIIASFFINGKRGIMSSLLKVILLNDYPRWLKMGRN